MINNILDFSGTLFALLATIAYFRISVFAWPLSLLAFFGDGYLYYIHGLYGDYALQLLYIFFTSYGWWKWRNDETNNSRNNVITFRELNYSPLEYIAYSFVIFFIIYLFCFALKTYLNSQTPIFDATTTILSLLGQWMTARKILANWLVWFFVDFLYAILYAIKGIPMHALLQVVYLGIAVYGYVYWLKLYKGQSEITRTCSAAE
jgi:nicotinamide mononucleotide transporter